MTILTPIAGWTDVPQIETITPVLGGAGGPMNQQAQALLNRVEALRLRVVSVLDFGAKGDGVTDDTAAFNAALLASKRVYVPAGTYVLLNVALQSGSQLFGDGWTTILKQKSTAGGGSVVLGANKNDGGTSSVSGNKTNIVIRDLQIIGPDAVPVFLEQCHLLFLSAVSDVLIDTVKFVGFKGDGLYIGSGDSGSAERHNERITIRGCSFDGVNKANRNCISVIDCNTISIYGNSFANSTQSNMPGAIDFEPNPSDPNAVLRNIYIGQNKFLNIGGNVGVIAFPVVSSITGSAANILVDGNWCDSCVGYFFHFNSYRAPTDTSIENNIVVRSNYVSNGNSALGIFDGKRIIVEDNTFSDMAASSLIAYTGATNVVRDMSILNNRFIRNGATLGGIGIAFFTVSYLTMDGNKFIDCGKGVTGSYAIDFNTGTSSYISLTNNEISSPTGKTLQGIVKEAAHTFTPATNKFMGNNLNGLGNGFFAEESDVLLTAYTPVIAGAGTTGTGTYTEQTGAYYRLGKRVHARIRIACTSHTATGQLIQISLPLPVAGLGPTGAVTAGAAGTTGVSTTGGVTVRLNAGITVNGVVGGLRLYFSGTGSFNQALIPAGAFEVECAVEYTTT